MNQIIDSIDLIDCLKHKQEKPAMAELEQEK